MEPEEYSEMSDFIEEEDEPSDRVQQELKKDEKEKEWRRYIWGQRIQSSGAIILQ